jgi:hypothetical protein
MFTRSPSSEPKAPEPRTTRPAGANGHQPSPSSGEKSVIGNDLKIISQGLKIISWASFRSMARSKAMFRRPLRRT